MFPCVRHFGHHLLKNNLITAAKRTFLSENVRTAVYSSYCDKFLTHTDTNNDHNEGVASSGGGEGGQCRTTGHAEVFKWPISDNPLQQLIINFVLYLDAAEQFKNHNEGKME